MKAPSPQPQTPAATVALKVQCLRASASDERGTEHGLLMLDPEAHPAAALRGVILPRGSEALACLWLKRVAVRVYLGEAALLDADLVRRLADEYGSERIGVYVPARRMQVGWSLDTESNADFRIMRPTVCEPCWEILMADGARTGTFAGWWMGEMFARGASSALLRVDIGDDTDLNILAGLTEQWGEKLWVAPLEQDDPDLESWVTLGHAGQLAVPDRVYDHHPYLVARRAAPAAEAREAETRPSMASGPRLDSVGDEAVA
jgi:hypothetical protein